MIERDAIVYLKNGHIKYGKLISNEVCNPEEFTNFINMNFYRLNQLLKTETIMQSDILEIDYYLK
jgi:hypothetical protein